MHLDLQIYFEIILRIILAVIVGGLVGLERESINRPAGFKTHILVCVGAALTMLISEYMFERYYQMGNMDPARLGAQVISGMGFLGAGTIIRDGVTVKGLTTAATLWTVACIGLAVGSGFYKGAIIASIIIFIVLEFLGKINVPVFKTPQKRVSIKLEIKRKKGVLNEIIKLLKDKNIEIKDIKNVNKNKYSLVVKLLLSFDNTKDYNEIVALITDIDEVKKLCNIKSVAVAVKRHFLYIIY